MGSSVDKELGSFKVSKMRTEGGALRSDCPCGISNKKELQDGNVALCLSEYVSMTA